MRRSPKNQEQQQQLAATAETTATTTTPTAPTAKNNQHAFLGCFQVISMLFLCYVQVLSMLFLCYLYIISRFFLPQRFARVLCGARTLCKMWQAGHSMGTPVSFAHGESDIRNPDRVLTYIKYRCGLQARVFPGFSLTAPRPQKASNTIGVNTYMVLLLCYFYVISMLF